jgi:dihydrofolate synthase/folylpolyglutamate synthase
MYLPHWPIPSTLGERKIDYETVFLRMKEILSKVGNPELNLPPVIHVAGTNGKGSVVAFLAAFFKAAGYKAHIYTSPHLHDCNERIILANNKITDNELFLNLEEVRMVAGETPVTFFEGFTLGALLAFSRNKADICIIEAGMGGRIDATNIIDKKLAAVITPISFDHIKYLGDYIERIALEKALIMRKHTPVIVSAQASKAKKIIKIIADDFQSPMILYDNDFTITLNEDNSFDFEYFSKAGLPISYNHLVQPGLSGSHQYINASTAIATISTINDFYPNFFKIGQKAINQGLKNVIWPSRLEKINGNLLKLLKNNQSELIIDGAHNQSGAYCLASWVLEQKIIDKKNNLDKKNFFIVGFSKNKCKKEFLANFIKVADEVVAIRVDGEPYPEEAEIITEIGKLINLKISPQLDLLDAINYLAKSVNYQPCKIIICGSLHLARDVRKFSKIPL